MFKNSYVTKFYNEKAKEINKKFNAEYKSLEKEGASKQALNGCLKRQQNALKALQDELKEIDMAEIPQALSFSVEWKRSRVWGYCPSCELMGINQNRGNSFLTSHASGCGYDKLSSVLARCLNDEKGIKKLLLKNRNKKDAPYGLRLKYDACVIFPYFEGGTGENCITNGLKFLGYELKNYASGKGYNYYYFEKVK